MMTLSIHTVAHCRVTSVSLLQAAMRETLLKVDTVLPGAFSRLTLWIFDRLSS
jgi:hypothetical protein